MLAPKSAPVLLAISTLLTVPVEAGAESDSHWTYADQQVLDGTPVAFTRDRALFEKADGTFHWAKPSEFQEADRARLKELIEHRGREYVVLDADRDDLPNGAVRLGGTAEYDVLYTKNGYVRHKRGIYVSAGSADRDENSNEHVTYIATVSRDVQGRAMKRDDETQIGQAIADPILAVLPDQVGNDQPDVETDPSSNLDATDPIIISEQQEVPYTVTKYVWECRCVEERYGNCCQFVRYVWRWVKVPVQEQRTRTLNTTKAVKSVADFDEPYAMSQDDISLDAPKSTDAVSNAVSNVVTGQFPTRTYNLVPKTTGQFPVDYSATTPHAGDKVWYQFRIEKLGARKLRVFVYAFDENTKTEVGAKPYADDHLKRLIDALLEK